MSTTVFPNKKEFCRLAKTSNLIPVCQEILADLETPVSCFLKMGDKPYSYLLESVEGGETMGRYSFLGGSHSLIFQSKGTQIKITDAKGKAKSFKTKTDPLQELQKILDGFKQAHVSHLPPFAGGAVGFIGYDAVRFFEKIPDQNRDPLRTPDTFFIFNDTFLIFDHINKKIKVVSNAHLDGKKTPAKAYEEAIRKIQKEIGRLRKGSLKQGPRKNRRRPKRLVIGSND